MDLNGIEETDYLCPVCAVDFGTLREFEIHKSTDDHRIKWLNKVYSSARLTYLKNKFGINIEVLNASPGIKHKAEDYTIEVAAEISDPDLENGEKNGPTSNGFREDDDVTLSFTLQVQNKGTDPYYLNGIDLLKTNNLLDSDTDVTIEDTHQMTKRTVLIKFQPGRSYDVLCKIKPGNISRVLHVPLLFEFQTMRKEKAKTEMQDPVKIFYVGRTLEIKGKIFSVRNFGVYVPGIYPEAEFKNLNELERELPLRGYEIPAKFQTLAYNNVPIDIYKEMRIDPVVKFSNYRRFFRSLLWLEELQQELDIQFYSKKGITLNFPKDDMKTGLKLVEFVDKGLAENRPCVMRKDKVFVSLMEEGKASDKPKWYEGIVHQVKNTSICLGFDQEKFIPKFDGQTKFNLEFTINRHNFKMCHRAVDLCTAEPFRNILFPQGKRKIPKKPEHNMAFPDITLYDVTICNNFEQLQAIQHIVFEKKSTPYVVFGPPGTGKTVTLVEAIKQILYLLPGSYVMACAPSNSAANVIAERLLEHFDEKHVYRMFSESRTKVLKDLPPKLLKASNFLPEVEKVRFPPKEELMKYRVIVCTYITAGKIASACFPPGHFTHVILDEAGHAMECEALVGVGGILTTNGKLILAGDPHQLGPMIRNLQAVSKGHIFKETGLDTSLLERIMSFSVYSNIDGPFDPAYVTKLVNNYRSHHTILKVSNELFYNNELKAKGDISLVNSFVSWPYLPTRGFPIIVHSVSGEDKTEARSPSYHNPKEVKEVVCYLKKVLKDPSINPEDIGIITPYRLQVDKLKDELRRLDKMKVKVGSVEDFQGEERKVIIISTVRASERHLAKDDLFKLGFLRNPKRFNVAVTRAQCLLILVCCTDVLLLDRNWRRLIDYARSHGGYIGAPYRVPKDSLDEIIKRMGDLDIRPNVGDISQKEIVEITSWKRNT